MGLFKKKQDPISERARELNKQIADLESQIKRLHEKEGMPVPPASPSASPKAPPPSGGAEKPAPPLSPSSKESGQSKREESWSPSSASPAPKLRSTALPHGPIVPLTKPSSGATSPAAACGQDPIFEDVGQNPFRAPAPPPARGSREEMGIRKDSFSSVWQRIKAHFRGPVTNNPKLVNYLAAGSIQGLRPLRYERRVARNRFIVLAIIFSIILWGILALLLKR